MKVAFETSEWSFRSDDDGRTVEGIIVPYNEVSRITEYDKVRNEWVTFDEQFRSGCCAAMVQETQRKGNAGFISLLLEHNERDFFARLGYAKHLREEKEGAFASFRLYPQADLEKVRGMLAESHTGLSISFVDKAKPIDENGIVTHRQIRIDHVAATPVPCYSGAAITAMRSVDVPPEEGAATRHQVFGSGTPALDEVQAWLASLRTDA